MKKTIGKPEYLQLVGLMAIAARHGQALEEALHMAREITAGTDPDDITGDMIWAVATGDPEHRASTLLARLGIAVEEVAIIAVPAGSGESAGEEVSTVPKGD